MATSPAASTATRRRTATAQRAANPTAGRVRGREMGDRSQVISGSRTAESFAAEGDRTRRSGAASRIDEIRARRGMAPSMVTTDGNRFGFNRMSQSAGQLARDQGRSQSRRRRSMGALAGTQLARPGAGADLPRGVAGNLRGGV